MNERIQHLAEQAGLKKPYGSDQEYIGDFDWREFARLVVQDSMNAIRQEWYNENNKEPEDNPRSVAIHVGTKGGLNRALNAVAKHFGIR